MLVAERGEGVYNTAGGSPTSIKHLAELMVSIISPEAEIRYGGRTWADDVTGGEVGAEVGEESDEPKRLVDATKDRLQRILHKELKTLPHHDPNIHEPLLSSRCLMVTPRLNATWVDEPYTFVSILDDTRMLHYPVVEPSLTTYETEILERVYEDLQDVLALKDTSKADKNAVLTDKTLSLFERYHALLDAASMHRIIYYLRRNFRGYEKINPLLSDPHIEDVSCDGVGVPVFLYHRKYRNIMTNVVFEEVELNSFVIKVCQKSGKQISIGEPMVDATMSDGSRLQDAWQGGDDSRQLVYHPQVQRGSDHTDRPDRFRDVQHRYTGVLLAGDREQQEHHLCRRNRIRKDIDLKCSLLLHTLSCEGDLD